MKLRNQNVLFILLGVLVALTFFFATSGRTKNAKQKIQQQNSLIEVVPEIVSCVQSIRVVKTEIKNLKDPDAVLTVEVENTSDIGIVAISMETTKSGEKYEVIQNTFGADEPLVIVKPHSRHTLMMAVANIHPGAPVRIGSVMFADGTEEGCKLSLESLHETKAKHESDKAAAKKEQP